MAGRTGSDVARAARKAAESGATTPSTRFRNARVRPLPIPLRHRRRGPRAGTAARARLAGAAMSGRDWRAFDAELRARAAEIAVELLGKPTLRAGQEWRWGRKGSLSVVDRRRQGGHVVRPRGGPRRLVCRSRRPRTRVSAARGRDDWIADRIGMARAPPPGPAASDLTDNAGERSGRAPVGADTESPETSPDDRCRACTTPRTMPRPAPRGSGPPRALRPPIIPI